MNLSAHSPSALFVGLFAASALLGSAVAAQEDPSSKPAPDTQPKIETPAWCETRPSMNIVVGYDAGKYFNLVLDRARTATKTFENTLCPGDQIRLFEVGVRAEPIGEPIVIETLADRSKVSEALATWKRATANASINDALFKEALAWWDGSLKKGQLPVLMSFTDTLESGAPRRALVQDFAWNEIPVYYQNDTLVISNLLTRKDARTEPLVQVGFVPKKLQETLAPKIIPSGGTTSYEDIMEAFVPPPKPEVLPPRVVTRVEKKEVIRDPAWAAWLKSWKGSLTVGGAFFALSLMLFLAGRFSKRSRKNQIMDNTITHDHEHEVTLILRDRLNQSVIRQETRLVQDRLYVSPASNADIVIPGPYSFEVIGSESETPMIRSANMLGLEIKRANGNRIMVSDGETISLRHGDRIELGAGHEVEVQIG